MLVPKQVIEAIGIAAKESSRFAISGVMFESKEGLCHALATDGRRAIRVDWHNGDEEPLENCIATREACKAALKTDAKELTLCQHGAAGTLAFATVPRENSDPDEQPSSMIKFKALDHNLPNIDTTIPEYSKDESVSAMFNIGLLSDLLNCMKKIGKGDNPYVTIKLSTGKKVCPVTLQTLRNSLGVQAIACLMPVDPERVTTEIS